MISTIISVMNREENLAKMLPTWTRVKKIKDFVIVDWSSKNPIINNPIIQEQMAEYKNIKVIRVENQKYFYRCKAWNLAFENTNPDNKILLKLDADYINMNPKWIDKLELTEDYSLKNYFLSGAVNGIRYPCKHELYGFLLVNKINFCQGYNENIDAIWGFEDAEFYSRIKDKEGIEQVMFYDMKKYIIHIPHSRKERFENLKIKRYASENKIFLEKFIPWNKSKYITLEDNDNYKRVELAIN